MGIILLYSVFIKGVGAVLEIAVQLLITHSLGVEVYGTYAYYINLIDIIFWFFFSGLMKSNIFYLSDKKTSISKFKKQYCFLYMLPVLIIISIIAALLKVPFIGIILLTVIMQFLLQDQSSTLIARGKSNISMTIEYFISRVFLLSFMGLFSLLNVLNLQTLMIGYMLQFVLVVLLFLVIRKKDKKKQYTQINVDHKKLVQYQISDMANGLISQAPVILQYLFVGAFESAFLSILAIIKKLISFISGPTSKVFLPVFSEAYKNNDINGLIYNYSLIARIQMFFISALGVLIIGFPEFVLKLFSPELLVYKNGLIVVGLVFLICTSLGPVTGFMQMTGSEKMENKIRIFTIVLMIITWILFRNSQLFAIYGMVVQMISETLLKYIYVCRWFKKMPINIILYILIWSPFIIYRYVIVHFHLEFSFIALIILCMLNVFVTLSVMMTEKDTRKLVKNMVYKFVHK